MILEWKVGNGSGEKERERKRENERDKPSVLLSLKKKGVRRRIAERGEHTLSRFFAQVGLSLYAL